MMAHHNTLADSDAVIVAYGRSPIGRAGNGSLIEPRLRSKPEWSTRPVAWQRKPLVTYRP